MVEPVRHRRTKGAETNMFEPKATASHLDSTQSGHSTKRRCRPNAKYRRGGAQNQEARLTAKIEGGTPARRSSVVVRGWGGGYRSRPCARASRQRTGSVSMNDGTDLDSH